MLIVVLPVMASSRAGSLPQLIFGVTETCVSTQIPVGASLLAKAI
ncbi:hypothetical protein EMIT093MI4_150021 [Pseudomonas sp. IT-93MI4]